MRNMHSRREFVKRTSVLAALSMVPGAFVSAAEESDVDFPLVDFHVHLSRDFTIEQAVELAAQRNMKFGIVEHPESKRIKSNEGLKNYIEKLRKYPVYIGLQPMFLRWSKHFAPDLLQQLDYVLMDADTIPVGENRHILLYNNHNYFENPQEFMEMYMNHIENILKYEPINIFGRPTFLPINFARYYNKLWTKERMMKIIRLAGERNIALEIATPTHFPDEKFIKLAKLEGLKFTFGTNARNNNAGKLHYGLSMVKACGLTKDDMFCISSDKLK